MTVYGDTLPRTFSPIDPIDIADFLTDEQQVEYYKWMTFIREHGFGSVTVEYKSGLPQFLNIQLTINIKPKTS